MVNILDLFSDYEVIETNSGYKMECPHCGMQGGRTHGFILFPETNTAYCHSTKKWFTMVEAYALKKKIISCLDGRDKGDVDRILSKEQFKEVLDFLQEEFDDEIYSEILNSIGIRTSIELPGDNVLISDFSKKLGGVMKNKMELFFREDIGEVVEIKKDSFEILKPQRFVTLAERYIKPWTYRMTMNGKMIVTKSMTQQTANIVLSSPLFQGSIPKIKRFFDVPIPIIYDGKLTFPKRGYDERFNSWLNTNSPEICEVSLSEAKRVIYNIYKEFCFQDKQDYVNAIAGLLTPFLRGLFTSFNVRTPMFCYMANRERAGKDYCAGITGITLEGYSLQEPPISSGERGNSGNNDELRKKIVSALISGKRRLHFANNKGLLNNAVLEGFLTSEVFSDRILGKNDSPNFDNEIDVSISGNIGMNFTPDLANRCRIINLFLDIEDANERSFENPNLHKWVHENRGLIISSIFTLIKNWYDKKCPKGSVTFTSFPEWAEICGGIMECAGFGNPCVKDKKMEESIGLDQETDEMKLLFESIYEKYPDRWMSKSDIKSIIESDNSIMPYFDMNDRSHQTKLGMKIDKFVGRILSDIRLIVENKFVRASRRKYKFTKEKMTIDKKLIFGEEFVENDIKDGNPGNLGNLCMSVYTKHVKTQSIGQRLPKLPRLPKKDQNNEKSDRKTQFWESEEFENIKQNFEKSELKSWLEQNPNHTDEELYEKFGVGSFKIKEEIFDGKK